MHGALERTAAAEEWRQNWPIVLVSMFGVSIAGIHFYSQGLFMAPLQQSFGWSRAQVTLGPTIYSILTAFTIAVSGVLADRIGPRIMAIAGICMFCLSFAALALIQGPLWQWVALWVIMAFTFPLIGPTIWTSAVVGRFLASRGLALAVTLAGLGLGSLVIPIVTEHFLITVGWRGTYVALPLIWGVVLLPLTLSLFVGPRDRPSANIERRPPPPPLVGLSIREGFRSSYFLRLAIAPAFFTFGLFALVLHFVAIVTGGGLDRASAAVAVGTVGIASIFGRLVAGLLLDRFHGRYIGAIMFATPLLSVIILLNFDGTMMLAVVAAMILGVSLGAEVDVMGYLLTRYIGTRFFSTFFAVLMALANVAAGIGSYAAGTIYDLTGSYTDLLWILMPVFLFSAIVMMSLGRYPQFPASETAS